MQPKSLNDQTPKIYFLELLSPNLLTTKQKTMKRAAKEHPNTCTSLTQSSHTHFTDQPPPYSKSNPEPLPWEKPKPHLQSAPIFGKQSSNKRAAFSSALNFLPKLAQFTAGISPTQIFNMTVTSLESIVGMVSGHRAIRDLQPITNIHSINISALQLPRQK
jgi:hypothetical protein